MIGLDVQELRVLFLALLGLILVTVAILVVSLVLAGRRARRSAGRQRHQEEDLDQWMPPVLSAPAGQVVVLLRDEPAHALLVEVGGERYRRLAEIKEPRVKRQVVEAAMDLVRFTGVLGVESIAPAPVEKTYSWREDVREEIRAQSRQTPPQPAGEDVEEQFLDLLSEMGPAPVAEKPTLATAMKQRRRPSKAMRQEQSHSMVDDIEAIVQRRLVLIPALAGRDLHVRQSPEGTVLFLFDGHDYEKLDEIPNLTAQQLVKDAIREWDETT